MAGRGTDILLGGSAEHMARQQCLAEEVAERLPKGDERFVDDDQFVYFFHVDGFFKVPREHWERIFGHFQAQADAEHEDVIALGGLHILGTERHEARRIDNQLRGRAGRQGDPGSSRFYLSLEDDLMRIFGSDRISGLMQRLGMEEGVPIEHGMVTRAIERAQKQVEAQNFSVRKHLLEYDDVMNKQRESTYTLRREILDRQIHLEDEEKVDTRGYVMALAEDVLDGMVDRFVGKDADPDDWDVPALLHEASRTFGLEPAVVNELDFDGKKTDEIGDDLWELAKEGYSAKEKVIGEEVMRGLERDIALQIVDTQWKDHLYSLDHLKEGIGLRGYGQRDPLVEYKKESFSLFQDMRGRVEEEIVRWLFSLRPVVEEQQVMPRVAAPRRATPLTLNNPAAEAIPAFAAARSARSESAMPEAPVPARTGGDDSRKPVRREEPKVGRNDPCPCGSGKKYKKCHGMAA
jgi:preprotein translocase subunit SecA